MSSHRNDWRCEKKHSALGDALAATVYCAQLRLLTDCTAAVPFGPPWRCFAELRPSDDCADLIRRLLTVKPVSPRILNEEYTCALLCLHALSASAALR
jgi:hypothetical protein